MKTPSVLILIINHEVDIKLIRFDLDIRNLLPNSISDDITVLNKVLKREEIKFTMEVPRDLMGSHLPC